MSRFAMANLNRGELDGKRILPAQAYDLMWKPASEQFDDIGIGWFLTGYKGHLVVNHSGMDTGFMSLLALVPDRKIGVVTMTNYDRGSLRVLSNAAINIALGLKQEPVLIKVAIDKVLFKTISVEGMDAAVRKYNELKAREPEAYDFQEKLLNNLGCNLMRPAKI